MDAPNTDHIDTLDDQQIKNYVDSIWSEVIDGYFLGDIENLELITLRPDKEVGLAAVGQFLSVASMLEFLGKTMHDGDTLLYYGGRKQERAWQYYFDHYLPPEINSLCKPIHNLIRHGSAHLFLPREVGLSKRPDEPLFFYENDLIIFNVTTFTNLFKSSLTLVKDELEQKPVVAKRFLKKYNEVRQKNLEVYTSGNFEEPIREYISRLSTAAIPTNIIAGVTIVRYDTLPSTTPPIAAPKPGFGISTKPAHPIPNPDDLPPT